MSFIPYQPNQQEQCVDEYTTSDEEIHAQYSVMNVTTKDSMADDELEEIEDNFSNLILEEEDFQLEEGYLVPEAAKKASIPPFPDLRISVNAVYKHMRTKCNLYLRRAEILREERDPDTTI
ncbi:uncharacterized protein BX663DRAFT_551849 [Cokeromyces recurvatus]|uniref:uncharacterized protein n=1 Tax=Cokeromyces recurvatus TaxID=90255 RepID=UPI00222115FE|nr:uncharacterized protein BX663DRAFT_551849 [Cokeromyces recurvatus]KAI7902992.1 hypothetical protein BX663DRAFT_551849 [Cokeromyces recurvatus]